MKGSSGEVTRLRPQNKLKEIMRARGLSQDALAVMLQKLGAQRGLTTVFDRSKVSRYASRRLPLTHEVIDLLRICLHCTETELLRTGLVDVDKADPPPLAPPSHDANEESEKLSWYTSRCQKLERRVEELEARNDRLNALLANLHHKQLDMLLRQMRSLPPSAGEAGARD